MLALLAVGFALVFGGCSNTKDETETEQDGGDETGGTGDSNNDSENPDDPNAPKTRYTSDAWVKNDFTGEDGKPSLYPTLNIALDSISLDENLKVSDYDYVKVNVTYTKNSKEVTNNKGSVRIEDADANYLSYTEYVNAMSSEYSSAYLPIKGVIDDFSIAKQISIQCNNAKWDSTTNANVLSEEIDNIKVNYIEFVKIANVKKGVSCNKESWGDGNSFVEEIVKAGKAGDKVVFAFVYDSEDKEGWGIAQLQSNDGEDKGLDLSKGNGKGSTAAGGIEEFEVSYDDVKSDATSGRTSIWFGNSAALQYVYIK